LLKTQQVLTEGYWVSEKTDGTRFILLIVPAKTNPHLEGFITKLTAHWTWLTFFLGIYFIDRKFSFYRIKGMDFLIQLYAPDGATLLDGEMVSHIGMCFSFTSLRHVQNLTSQTDDEETLKSSPMYLIFDLMVVNGVSFLERSLTQRYSFFPI